MFYIIRDFDGGTVSLAADVDGSVMSKALSAECAAYARPITILATVTDASLRNRCVWAGRTNVREGATDVYVDPGRLIPSIDDLLAQISAMEAATTAALAAAEGALQPQSAAPLYDPDGTYAIDDLCTYLGVLYRCSATISSPEAWTAGHWTAVDVAELLDEKFTTAAASTSAAGLAPQATAPAAGLRNILGIDSGETGYANKALYDTTAPSTQAYGDSAAVGTAMTAARRDHKHAMPNNPAASTSAAGLAPQATAPAAGLRNVLGIDNTETGYANKPLFDATAPSTQAFGDAAAVGTAMTAARRDHKHAMPVVVNGLSSTSATSALAAAQGKALNDAKADRAASPTEGNIATLDANGNPTDGGTALSDVNSQLADIANYPRLWRKTAVLSVAQVTPGSSSPLDATVKTVATQAGSGDPSPSNIRAITGRSSAKVKRTGKNLASNAAYLAVAQYNDCVKTEADLQPSTTYFVSLVIPSGERYYPNEGLFITTGNTPVGTGTRVSMALTTKPVISKSDIQQYTAGSENRWRIFKNVLITTTSGTASGLQIELGSVATAYEPYSGTELTLTPATALYGVAGAEDEIGVDGHEVHNTALITFNGTENWNRSQSSTTGKFLYTLAVSPATLSTPNSQVANIVCSHYVPISGNSQYLRSKDHCIAIPSQGGIFIYDATYEDEVNTTTFKAYLAAQYTAGTPVQVLYQLATPTTAQGTAQALTALAQTDKYTPRLNNVYSDGGNVVVGYAQHPSKTYDFLTEKTGYGIASGLIVSAQSTPNMTVAVSGGVAYMADGTRFAPIAVSALAINTADATNPRIDIVYLASDGVVSYLAGTEAATPVAPTVPTGGLLLSQISVAAGATTVVTANITDMRKGLWSDAWYTPTLLNSWTTYSSKTPKYRQDLVGRVRLKGAVAGGTLNTTAFTLPAGYRPLETQYMPVVSNGAFGYITIDTSGNVKCVAGSTTYFALDGVTFPTV